MYYFSLETLNPTIHFIHFYISIFFPGPFNYDQRKNNLCRRIRIEKQKKEKEAGKSKKDGAILEVQHSVAPAQLAPQPQAVGLFQLQVKEIETFVGPAILRTLRPRCLTFDGRRKDRHSSIFSPERSSSW